MASNVSWNFKERTWAFKSLMQQWQKIHLQVLCSVPLQPPLYNIGLMCLTCRLLGISFYKN